MEGSEMSQMQISLWLQCLFLFSLIWSVGGTMNGDSRIKFDHFFRTIITGTDTEHPRPKSFKLGKVYTSVHVHEWVIVHVQCLIFVLIHLPVQYMYMYFLLVGQLVSRERDSF